MPLVDAEARRAAGCIGEHALDVAAFDRRLVKGFVLRVGLGEARDVVVHEHLEQHAQRLGRLEPMLQLGVDDHGSRVEARMLDVSCAALCGTNIGGIVGSTMPEGGGKMLTPTGVVDYNPAILRK